MNQTRRKNGRELISTYACGIWFASFSVSLRIYLVNNVGGWCWR